jgi:cation transport ATPase
MPRRFLHKYLSRENAVRIVEREKHQTQWKAEEVRMVEISINTKQAIAIMWTIFAFALSLAVVLTFAVPYYSPGAWQILVVLFFALLLVITLPVYLLLALWQIVSKSDNA